MTIIYRYLSVTREVLKSVQKMEESLKRLKKVREKTPTLEGRMSDDDKIRLQLHLDVENYISQVKYDA